MKTPCPSTRKPSLRSCESVRRGEGRESRKSDARAQGTNPRFPWEPSATMLTYRLTGTKVGPRSTTTNTPIITPCPTGPQQVTTAESSRTTVRHGTRRRIADFIYYWTTRSRSRARHAENPQIRTHDRRSSTDYMSGVLVTRTGTIARRSRLGPTARRRPARSRRERE